jgi:hypothetical protein
MAREERQAWRNISAPKGLEMRLKSELAGVEVELSAAKR